MIYVSVFVGLSGVLQALLPIIGQLYGARRHWPVGAHRHGEPIAIEQSRTTQA